MGRIVLPAPIQSDLQRVAFSFTTPSPLILGAVVAGQAVDRVAVVITTAFDSVSATITVGTSGSPGLLLGAGEIQPHFLGQYETDQIIFFPLNDIFQLVINPAGSIQGAGLLFYAMR